MYANPELIRSNAVKISLNDLEHDLIQAWVNYRGGQKATFLREMLLEAAKLDLGINGEGNSQQSEARQMQLSSY